MRLTLKTTMVAGALAICGLMAASRMAHAGGCCGGGGGGGGVRYAARAYYAPRCNTSCNMAGMNMAGMNMASMPMAAAQSPAASMQGMDMSAAPAPAAPAAMPAMNMPAPAAPAAAALPAIAPVAAGSKYFCPMHPNVVANGPASCPQCGMALKRK